MSTTEFRTEVIALLDEVGLAGGVWSEAPPATGPMPYVRVLWDITDNPTLQGDGGTSYTRAEQQVSVWELSGDEDGTVANLVKAALDGKVAGGVRLRYSSSQRIEEEGDVIQTTLSFTHRAPFPT